MVTDCLLIIFSSLLIFLFAWKLEGIANSIRRIEDYIKKVDELIIDLLKSIDENNENEVNP